MYSYAQCKKALTGTTHRRSPIRPTSRRRQPEPTRNVEPHMERQHHRHTDPHLNLRTLTSPEYRPASPLHHIRHVHTRGDREPIPPRQPHPAQGMAEDRLPPPRLPQRKDGAKHAHARVVPLVEGGRGESVGHIAGVSGYESGRGP